jgi:spore coat polysaccharide biosynthesis predicted glycosyltransferase SpsG
MIPKILNHLKKYDFEKYVFVTDSMENIEDIKKYSDKKTKLIFNPDAENIKNTMLEVDFAITAAGQTIIEATKCKLPCISIQIAQNQENNVKYWEENGVILNAGIYNEENIFKILEEKIRIIIKYSKRREFVYKGLIFNRNINIINIVKRILNELDNYCNH